MTNRRVRVKRGADGKGTVITAPNKKKLTCLVNDIADNIKSIEQATADNKELYKELDSLMSEFKLGKYDAARGHADYVVPASKGSTLVDVKKFKAAVDEKDFLDSVKVSITEARKVLSEKELDKVSKKIPGKTKDPVLKVTPK